MSVHTGARRRITTGIAAGALGVSGLFLTAVPAAAATTATFLASAGVLSVSGDNQNNSILVRHSAAGLILVNGGAVAVSGGTPTVANTQLVQIVGMGGSDPITLSELNGALPRTNPFGGADADTYLLPNCMNCNAPGAAAADSDVLGSGDRKRPHPGQDRDSQSTSIEKFPGYPFQGSQNATASATDIRGNWWQAN